MFKWLDRKIGTVLCRALARWSRIKGPAGENLTISNNREAKYRFLIIKLCCLGDAVLLIPTLRNIKNNFPNASLTMLTTHRTSNLFRHVDYVDQVIDFPIELNPLDYLKCLRTLARRKFDGILTFDPWYQITAILAVILRPKFNLGFYYAGMPYLKGIFTRSTEYTERKHVVETYLDLGKLLGVEVTDAALEFPLEEQWRDFAREFFSKENLVQPVVGIFPASSARWACRRWASLNYARLADRLITDYGAQILILSGRGQEQVTAEIVSQMQGKVVLAPDSISVLEMAALIARCRIFVAGDSAPTHIAAAVGTPTMAIFSNVSALAYHPYLDPGKYVVIRKELDCSPCAVFGEMPPCPHDYECTNEITVGMVMAGVEELWRKSEPNKREGR